MQEIRIIASKAGGEAISDPDVDIMVVIAGGSWEEKDAVACLLVAGRAGARSCPSVAPQPAVADAITPCCMRLGQVQMHAMLPIHGRDHEHGLPPFIQR